MYTCSPEPISKISTLTHRSFRVGEESYHSHKNWPEQTNHEEYSLSASNVMAYAHQSLTMHSKHFNWCIPHNAIPQKESQTERAAKLYSVKQKGKWKILTSLVWEVTTEHPNQVNGVRSKSPETNGYEVSPNTRIHHHCMKLNIEEKYK